MSSNEPSGETSIAVTNLTDGFSLNIGTVTMSAVVVATAVTVTVRDSGGVASPHGLSAGDKIFFETTGALYSGITEYQVYYVSATNLTANTFEFSSTGSLPNVINTGTQSGVHTLYKVSSVYLLLGNIGSESAEIVRVSTINLETGVITLSTSTKFGHSESTKVTVVPYNQVGFFWTAAETFATTTPVPNSGLITYMDLQVSDWFTVIEDGVHDTGYGWYVFYNSESNTSSTNSNSLPYEGFDRNTVEDVLNDFYALLNNKELKLVTRRDALSWMNEGISIIRNKLNMTNTEYTASALSTLSIVPGTIEYLLPTDFSKLTSLTGDASSSTDISTSNNVSKYSIDYISLREAFGYIGTATRYYIRGKYIGILPTPVTTTSYSYMYLTKSTKLNSNSDEIDFPDNGFYSIKDWMMYRAYMKFNNPNAAMYYKMFQENMNQMIITSMDRDCALDTMNIDASANV